MLGALAAVAFRMSAGGRVRTDAGGGEPQPQPPDEPGEYQDAEAELYDREFSGVDDTEAAVEFLAGLAGAGPALELGVGAGRVAVPLARRGVPVHGIDNSEAMLARLRAKPDGPRVAAVCGNFADVEVGGLFSVIFVVFDTLTALMTQQEQVRCFRNAARHLAPGGVFVVEASMPDLPPGAADTGHRLFVKSMLPERVHLEASWHDPVAQQVYTQWIVVRDGSVRLFPFAMRYAWPSELDLMAQLAGLGLRERWGGWGREPYTAASAKHISVYDAASHRREAEAPGSGA